MSRTWHEVDTPEPGDFFLSRATRPVVGALLRHAAGTPWVHGGVYVGLGRHLVVETSAAHGEVKLVGAMSLVDPRWFRVDGLGVRGRAWVAHKAERMVGTPFPPALPFLTALIRRHNGNVTAPYADQPWWVRQLLNGPHTLYCLQIIERAYREAGFPLFDDGRPEGLVTPRCLLDRVAAA